MKNTKRLLAILLAFVLAFAMCACADDDVDDDVEETGVANPIVETNQAGVLEATGVDIAAPEGATDVEYSYIKGDEENQAIAQVEFDFEDNDYCYRIQMTDALSIYGEEAGSEAPADLMDQLNEHTNVGAQLSGMYGKWKAGGTTVVDYCDGVFALNEGEEGFISWIDVVPGALYSLSMDDDCTQALLDAMAAKIFQPMQGDA